MKDIPYTNSSSLFLFYYPFHEKESHASLHDDGLPDGGERGSLGMVQGMDVHHRKMGGKDGSGMSLRPAEVH